MAVFENATETSALDVSLSEIGSDIVKYSPSKILGTIANLMLVPIYTSLLSPAQYGLYNVAIGVLSLLCIIFSDWVGVSGLRFFKEHSTPDSIKTYFSSLLFLLVANLGTMYIAAFLLFKPICNYFNIPPDLLQFVLVLIIPVAIRALLFQVLRAQIKPLAYTFSVIVNQFTTIAFAVYFIIHWNLGPKAILLGMVFSIVFIDFVMLYQSKMGKSLQLEEIKFKALNNFYRYGWPIALSSLGMWIINQSNKFVLQHFKGSYYNGLCGVGFNLTFSIVLPLLAIITLAAIPRIFIKYEAGQDVRPIITRLTGYYFLIFAPVIFILCVYPKEMVALFSNKDYADSYILIPFLALSIFAFGLSEYTTIQYHLVKKTYIDTIIKIIPGLVGLGLSILLIPDYNILGVGVATFASNLLYLILSLFIRIKDLDWIPPRDVMRKTAIAIIACFIGVMTFKHFFTNPDLLYFPVQIIALTFIYLAALKLQSIKSLSANNE